MASFGGRLGVGLRAGPDRCTKKHCNNKLITHIHYPTTQDRRPAWRPIERPRFILRSRPFINNAHQNNKTTSSLYINVKQHKTKHSAIHKPKTHYYHRAFHQSASRLVSCLDTPLPADVDAVQDANINSDIPLDGAAEVNSDHLLCIQSIHNPLHHIVSHPSDHDETYGTALSLFEATMLSSPRRSKTTSASNNTTIIPPSMGSQPSTRMNPPMRTYPLIADGSSPYVSNDIWTSTKNSDPRQWRSNSTTTTQAEINDLADRFSALHITTPTTTTSENRADLTIHAINEGKWPWAARSTSTQYDVSPKRYEANLLMLMHDFVLKARHQYVLTKKWPAKEIERSALALAAKARKIWAKGTREEEISDEEGEKRNYLEELDWFWRYWGLSSCREEQKVWGYVVGGGAGRYNTGATNVGAEQKESQRGVDF